LKDIPDGEDYFFSIRDPVDRFRSSFYSRKRKGHPRIYAGWTPYDELAFAEFEHANDLAESLFKPGVTGLQSWSAMKSLRHTAKNQSDWFYCCGNFLRVRPPIWIIRQEKLLKDLSCFLQRAGFEIDLAELTLDDNPVSAHKNDYSGTPELSEMAISNLRRWYSQDFALLNMCETWLGNGGSI
jgi:hypothetical protein